MCITVPLGATLTWMRVDLQGLVFYVVMGYTDTAMLLSTLLLMSDWDRLSKEIQDRMADEECSVSDYKDKPFLTDEESTDSDSTGTS